MKRKCGSYNDRKMILFRISAKLIKSKKIKLTLTLLMCLNAAFAVHVYEVVEVTFSAHNNYNNC